MTPIKKNSNKYSLASLQEIMQALRDPETGCPWDIEQDFKSIAPYTIEEAYEVVDAIENGSKEELCDELGDLLLQVVFHSQMAAELGEFTIDDVITAICEKMVRRHPHVFANTEVNGVDEVKTNWEAIKQAERANKQNAKQTTNESALSDIPVGLPALTRAYKIGKKAKSLGFDWRETSQVLDKLKEEIAELEAELPSNNKTRITDEMGDVFFAATQLARHLKIDAEASARGANNKFSNRFRHMEQNATKPLSEYTDAELEEMWNNAKVATA